MSKKRNKSKKNDSIFIKIECACPATTIKKNFKKKSNTNISCYKYIKINTCNDTIVSKSAIGENRN